MSSMRGVRVFNVVVSCEYEVSALTAARPNAVREEKHQAQDAERDRESRASLDGHGFENVLSVGGGVSCVAAAGGVAGGGDPDNFTLRRGRGK